MTPSEIADWLGGVGLYQSAATIRAQAEALKIATEELESIMHAFKPDFDEDQSADAAEAEIMAARALARIKEGGA